MSGELPPKPVSGFAVPSLVMGMMAVPTACVHGCGAVMGVGAIVLGVMALRDVKAHPELGGRWMAVTGICLGVVFIAVSLTLGIWLFEKFMHPG